MIIMLLMIVMDLLSSGLTLSDFGYKEANFVSNCQFDAESAESWIDQRRIIVVLSLFFIFSRGIIVLLLNIGLFVGVVMFYLRLGKQKTVAPVVSQSKTNQEDLWIPYPGLREDDQTPAQDYPDAHHGPDHAHTSHYQEPAQNTQAPGGDSNYQAPGQSGHTGGGHHQDPARGYRDVYYASRHQEPDKNIRRAPSFADRLKEKETNFSNKALNTT